VSYRDRCEGDEHAISPANDSAVREYLRPDDPPLLLPSYTRPAAIRQKINALASRTHVQARDVFDLHVLGDGTLRGIDTGFLRRWLDDATLRSARPSARSIPRRVFRHGSGLPRSRATRAVTGRGRPDRASIVCWRSHRNNTFQFLNCCAGAFAAVPIGIRAFLVVQLLDLRSIDARSRASVM
jgi:hypothetical protein